ncbi:hypothetical protein ABT116_36765 [Streptomyces sp. NPDC002130]|uniref:hypothetical protein n=1 Tax=Streptomyces sp. NPDC002130 TaxID=3155568 RepID=UPI0033235064
MTHRARHDEREDSSGTSAHVAGRRAAPGRGEFLEFLGLTLAAGAFVLFVTRPEVSEGLVRALAARASAFVH